MGDIVWKSFKVSPTEGDWEPASYNITWEDGREYGRWRRILRQHRHGLTMISRYTAPPGKAWKIIGKASALGEEVYIMEGGYYNKAGRLIAGPLSVTRQPTAGAPWGDPVRRQPAIALRPRHNDGTHGARTRCALHGVSL